MTKKLRVGILGATGMVGQRFVELLEDHPQFQITALAASDRSQGKTFAEACTWRLAGAMPEFVRSLQVQAPEPPLDCDLVFSSLPGDIARETESSFAAAGYPVISNSSAFRMDHDVPLLIPEINPEHLALIGAQKKSGDGQHGFIVTNPNCSTIMLALALAPLDQQFGIESVIATTMQALSGAGYPGVASLAISDNVLPYIESEEEKIEQETLKILGKLNGETINHSPMKVSAQCNRVNVSDGHMAAVRVKFKSTPSLSDVKQALSSFSALPQELKLHSAPQQVIIVREEKDRPQPRLDRDAGNGMSITVGRLQPDNVFDYRFVALSHNTIRGAAGAAILNAELMIATGHLK
ncbi:MAG TPA: aspartate-semialdehyde dehydrogenase [Pyrinomonadaceae bacterium]|nr:aspartate-semialdehyde dehydrogenase [Pyrinomonadaceae bacterium]